MIRRTLVTCEEFERISASLGPCELIDGEIVQMSPGKPAQCVVTGNFVAILREFVLKHRLGRVLTNEAGIRISEDPPRIRGADVAFISYKRLPRGRLPDQFLRVAPELIVEILGADASWSQMEEKVKDYHGIGVDMVWVADPNTRTIKTYPRKGESAVFSEKQIMDGGKVLPGFRAPVARFFEQA